MSIKITSILFLSFLSTNFYSQAIHIDSILSQNTITEYKQQKLILIDFWATWCAPCVTATRQLEILQEDVADKVFMISMSDEKNKVILNFLKDKPIKLMVVSDRDNENILKYQIDSRPYSVLINYQGNLLWKGYPADLKSPQINSFYDKIKGTNTKSIKELLEQIPHSYFNEANLTQDSTIEIKLGNSTSTEEEFIDPFQYIYKGKVANLAAKLLWSNDVKIDESLNKSISLNMSKKIYDSISKQELLNQVLVFSNLKLETNKEKRVIIDFKLVNPKLLWDTTQMDLSEYNSKYNITTDRIQADNISIKEICYILGKLKNKTYVYQGNNNQLYDWDFNFNYDQFMEEELKSSFGVEINHTSKVEIPIYKLVEL